MRLSPMSQKLLKTPLFDWHQANGGRIVDFAGWAMPVQYRSIVEEHQATRSAVGLFDVSHMGRIDLFGAGAAKFLDHILTRRVTDLRPWRARYSFICNEQAGILDDVLIYRLGEEGGGSQEGRGPWQLVVNASNRPKILEWLARNREGYDVRIVDATESTAMIAVQGPRAAEILAPLCNKPLGGMKYFQAADAAIADVSGHVSRTGYTGEDGFEFICTEERAEGVWRQLADSAAKVGGCAAGLGARDTLRLEAALPLYGHELSEEITPAQAGLPFAYDLNDRDFLGSDIVRRLEGDETLPVRAGLELQGRRPAREGARVLYGGAEVGAVTSGTFSPTLQRPIALAYVHRPADTIGREVTVDIRGQQAIATVVELPFYRRRK
jgi:aminomethyltransferase